MCGFRRSASTTSIQSWSLFSSSSGWRWRLLLGLLGLLWPALVIDKLLDEVTVLLNVLLRETFLVELVQQRLPGWIYAAHVEAFAGESQMADVLE